MSDVIRTRAMFCDYLNLPRGKFIPASVAQQGAIGFSRGVFGVTFDRDLIPVPGSGVYDGLPDMELVLDESRRLGWQQATDVALGDLYVDGAPFGLCARSALKRAVENWQSIGLQPRVGIELEAYVFEQNSDGVWQPYNTPGAFVYGCGPANDPAGIVDTIWHAADACAIPVESINGEFDNGQFELTLHFSDAIKACDDAFLFRTLARELALEQGLLLTFLPKPIPDRGGSGLHVNFSLVDNQDNNIMAPHGELSQTAQQAIAGLLHHHEGLAGLLAMTLNSYDRLTPGNMAGYWANWALDHRLVTVRCATQNVNSARLEHRMADGATNPYLAVCAVLQAAYSGVIQNLDLPAAEDLDGIENTRAKRHVPASLTKALDALDLDTQLRELIGIELCDAVIFLKRDECKRLAGKSVDEIRDYYLPFV